MISTNLLQGYTVDLSKSSLPTTGRCRMEVSPADPQGAKTSVADLFHVSVAAVIAVVVTDEAAHNGTALNRTTSTAPFHACRSGGKR